MKHSKINPLINIEHIEIEPKSRYFDVKTSKAQASELAPYFSAFANAEGGSLVVGICDKTKEIEGIKNLSLDEYNNIILAPKDYCSPAPNYILEKVPIITKEGEPDEILIFHIEAESERVIKTKNGVAYLRINDTNKELKEDEFINLKYARSARYFEDEINQKATLKDLDLEILKEYKEKVSSSRLSDEQFLKAKGFLRVEDNQTYLTNGAVLLFAKNVTQFFPNCRIRFLKYNISPLEFGERIYVTKNISIECSLLKLIKKVKQVIPMQLKDFLMLNKETGEFVVVPEYPEFAWLEGIINAVIHRDYAFQRSCIVIAMYNNRLEIISPGRLPNIVTLENMLEMKYSKNPKIARVFSEFGWRGEHNKGIEKIYEDMRALFLDKPRYSEPNNTVKLTLKNNIATRNLKENGNIETLIGEDIWRKLDAIDKKIVSYIANRGKASRKELEEETNRGSTTITTRVSRLIEKDILIRVRDINSTVYHLELKKRINFNDF